VNKLSTILTATAAAVAMTLTGSVTAVQAATVTSAAAHHKCHHHKRHCTHKHPCVFPGYPNIPASIIGD
jgi:hypothetical protein